MPEPELIRNILKQNLEAIGRIERRFAGIACANDFVSSDEGLDRLDAICMMLIALGESCKHLDKITDGGLLSRYPSVDWKGVKGCGTFSAISTSTSTRKPSLRSVKNIFPN